MAHVFLDPFAMSGRVIDGGCSIKRTADASASVTFKVKYWATDDIEDNAVTTSAAESSASSDNERVIIALTGLIENQTYNYKIIQNLNGGGDSTLARTGQFYSGTSSNDATVCGMVIGDIHNGNESAGAASAEKLQDVDSVADVMVSRGVQVAIQGGDHIHNVSKTYLDGVDNAALYAQCVTATTNFFGMWERPISLAPFYWVNGNHEFSGCNFYGDISGFYNQLIATQILKRFLLNPATDISEAASEWADAVDVAAEEPWVVGDNLPPFETQFAFRHGPILFVGIDSERYGKAENDEADVATMGASQKAWAIATAKASDAIWKVLIVHRPSGGYHQTNEAYRRGSLPGVATKTEYEWGASFYADVIDPYYDMTIGMHDHVAYHGRVTRKYGVPSISGGSPTAPFALDDPATGSGYGTSSGEKLEADYYANERGVWVYDANSLRMRWRYIRTVNDDRDGTLDEVQHEFEIVPRHVSRTMYGANGVHYAGFVE